MSNIDKQALRMRNYLNTAVISGVKLLHLTTDELSGLLDDLEAAEHTAAVDHEAACSLVEENEEVKRKLAAAEQRMAEMEASHRKLRNTMAAIHNTIRMDGSYTPLAAILNAAKRAYEESADAGIGKGE